MSLVDRQYLSIISHDEIKKIVTSIKIRDIEAREHDSSKYVELNFYLNDTLANEDQIDAIDVEHSTIAHFKREVHVMNDLRAKLLIDIDILDLEVMIVDLDKRQLIIESCDDVIVSLSLKSRDEKIDRVIRVKDMITVSSHITMIVLVRYRDKVVSSDRDYNFFLKSNVTLDSNDDFLAHIVSTNIIAIQVRNATDKTFIVVKNIRVENLQNFDEEDCYLASSDDDHLTVVSFSNWIKQLRRAAVARLITFATYKSAHRASSAAITIDSAFTTSQIDSEVSSTSLIIVDTTIEIVMSNEIIVYEDLSAYNRLFTIAEAYSSIWRDNDDTVNVSEEDWMFISILLKAKSDASKIYSLSPEDKKVVDQKFDRLHSEEKMSWTKQLTSYEYSVFVMWRTINEVRKERVIVNIRDLNKIFMFDAYLMSLQFDVLSTIQEVVYLSVMNCASFFHQWLIRTLNRHKLIVISHRDSEQ